MTLHAIFKLVLIILYFVGMFAYIASVGEERKPITGVGAALTTFINGAILIGLVHWL